VFRFQKGPVFTQLLLADEINRAPPKTQSALLEAMQERSISFAGQTHVLPSPFFVLATQNPIEQAGTYPLPEAQLDRFLLEIVVDYPSEQDEVRMLAFTTSEHKNSAPCVLNTEQLQTGQRLVRDIVISDDMLSYGARLIRATRPHESSVPATKKHVAWGAGPRAGQALVLAAKARALMHNRLAVTREDLLALLPSVLRHRVIRNFEAEADGIAIASIIAAIAEHINVD
jgi:MoxR-like ATPase